MDDSSRHLRTSLAIVMVVVGVGVALLLVWQLAQVLLLLFAAVLVATLLRTASDFIARLTRIPPKVALTLAALLILGIVGGLGVLLGAEIGNQFAVLGNRLPAAVKILGQEFGLNDLDIRLASAFTEFLQRSSLLGDVAGRLGEFLALLLTVLLVVIAGTYLAIDPDLYRRGFVRLFPPGERPLVTDFLSDAAAGLRAWLLAQLLTMAYIGIVTGLVMWMLGLPAALALGLIAGLLEFIPYAGPILAAFPALLLALTSGNPTMVFWVAGAYLVIQQFEGNVLSPLVQQWAVRLPPALGLFALIAAGVLFGPLGVFVGTPLLVVIVVFVRHSYLRRVLKDELDVLQPALVGAKRTPEARSGS